MALFTPLSALFGFVAAAKFGRKTSRVFWQRYGQQFMYNDARRISMMLQRAHRKGWLSGRDYQVLFDKLWLAVDEGDRMRAREMRQLTTYC